MASIARIGVVGAGLAGLAAALAAARTDRGGARARQVHAVTTQGAQWQLQPDATTDLRGLADRLATLVAEPA